MILVTYLIFLQLCFYAIAFASDSDIYVTPRNYYCNKNRTLYKTCRSGTDTGHSLRILIVSQNFPIPSLHGCDKRVFHVIESLIGLNHSVSLVPFSSMSGGQKSFTGMDYELLASLKIPIVNNLEILIRDKKNEMVLLKKPLLTYPRPTDSFRKILEIMKPDIVMTWLWFWDHRFTAPGLLYDEAHAYCYHNEQAQCKIITWTDDAHGARQRQLAERLTTKVALTRNLIKAHKMEQQEKRIYEDSDMVVSITQSDAQTIANLMLNPIDTVTASGNEMENEEQIALQLSNLQKKIQNVRFVDAAWENQRKPDIPGDRESHLESEFESRTGLVFVGNGRNPTNAHALKWYLHQIAPLLNNENQFDVNYPLTVVGGFWNVDDILGENADLSKYVNFTGHLSTERMLSVVDSARVFISPIVVSTGINTKNVLALSRNIPLVTTIAGAAGMCEECDFIKTIVQNRNAPLTSTIYNKKSKTSKIMKRDPVLRHTRPFGDMYKQGGDPHDYHRNIQSQYGIEDGIPFIICSEEDSFIDAIKQCYNNETLWTLYHASSKNHIRNWFNKDLATQEIDTLLQKAII